MLCPLKNEAGRPQLEENSWASRGDLKRVCVCVMGGRGCPFKCDEFSDGEEKERMNSFS